MRVKVKNVAHVASPPWKMQIESPIKFCPPYKGLHIVPSPHITHIYDEELRLMKIIMYILILILIMIVFLNQDS